MRQTKVVLTYADGRTEEIDMRPSIVIAAERHFGAVIPPREGTLWMSWHALGRPQGSFETWLDTVDSADEVTRTGPTEATGQSADSSPTSPSEPE